MGYGAITANIDWAQITLYAFWIFFAGLVYYLRQEDKREGYPLVSDHSDAVIARETPPLPRPKTFLLKDGRKVRAPARDALPQPSFAAEPLAPWTGAPLRPLGNPMVAGAGPAAYALRADTPDLTYTTNIPRIAPLRVASDHHIDAGTVDPRGMQVFGADGEMAAEVSDVWLDRDEAMVRYLEVTLADGSTRLLPASLANINAGKRTVRVNAVLASQFADAPMLANPDQVSLREEDRISAYFASGFLYATPARSEPLI